ncbi:MAG: HDIG domain-containing metalloprotein [Candidatus Latescibacterota bacterium]|nr:HDIG domain-containing metalloprotein [Candidatus Latescibacterota bacterium]
MNIPAFFQKFTLSSDGKKHSNFNNRNQMNIRLGIKLILGVFAVGMLTYFSPYQRPYNIPDLRLGGISSEEIRAPFKFNVPKLSSELETERALVEESVPTLLTRSEKIGKNELSRIDSVFKIMIPALKVQMVDSLKQRHLQRALPKITGSLSTDALNTLIRLFSTASGPYVTDYSAICHQIIANFYTTGILPSKEEITAGPTPFVRMGQRTFDVDLLYSEKSLKQGEMISFIAPYTTISDHDAVEATLEFLSLFIRSNVKIETKETQRRRSAAMSGVASIKRVYAADELIVDKNTEITAEHRESLNALAQLIAQREAENPVKRFTQLIASATISAFLVLIFGYYLATREREIFNNTSSLLLITILTVMTAGSGSYISNNELAVYLVPTPLTAMLVTILISPQIGLMLSYGLALFIGNLFGDFYVALTCALTSSIAVFTVVRVRHRNQFYKSMIFLPIAYALLIAATEMLRFVPFESITQNIIPGIFIGIAAPILTIGLLPIFESIFNITTDITLLELSDLNRPLLRELAVRAPGTYTHSLIMANLSESAAEGIGCNALLARVGCYYHDIGKMLKPEYFSENQALSGGRNPHDNLTPNMSMLIISSHVKDGIELAEEHGLPKAICDLIPQHHGTTVIEYFYNRAIELGSDGVRREDFRYDGPRPQTREGGILMLADSVESAARTLPERTTNRIRQLVRKIIQQKFTGGELNECALTLEDLHKIEESFIPVLMGTLHGRVEYPWQQRDQRRRLSTNGN